MSNVFKEKYPLLDFLIYYKGNNWGETYNESQRSKLASDYESFISSTEHLPANLKSYFDSRLHDSWVENISYHSDKISITLNEFSSHCFADAICDHYKVKIPHKKRVLPVTFQFLTLRNYTVSWINGNSKIIYLKKDKYIPKLSEFLYEQIISIEENRIALGLLFCSGLKGNKSYLLFQIECGEIIADENQRQAFCNLFGGNYTDLFDLFWTKKQSGMYFDYSSSLELIKEKN